MPARRRERRRCRAVAVVPPVQPSPEPRPTCRRSSPPQMQISSTPCASLCPSQVLRRTPGRCLLFGGLLERISSRTAFDKCFSASKRSKLSLHRLYLSNLLLPACKVVLCHAACIRDNLAVCAGYVIVHCSISDQACARTCSASRKIRVVAVTTDATAGDTSGMMKKSWISVGYSTCVARAPVAASRSAKPRPSSLSGSKPAVTTSAGVREVARQDTRGDGRDACPPPTRLQTRQGPRGSAPGRPAPDARASPRWAM